MQKDEAIRAMTECAAIYHDELVNRNLLFLFGPARAAEYMEALFLPRHFMHLTGVIAAKGAFHSSTDFYDRCLKKRLRTSDFELPADGTAEMKLSILRQLMRIHYTAKMVSDYDRTKSLLYTEKLAGSVSACMGFVKDGRFYVPNTALREDIRDISVRPQQRILAVYRKTIKEPKYTERCYLAKGVAEEELDMPELLLR